MQLHTTLRLSSLFSLLALACVAGGCEKKKSAPAFTRATAAVEAAGINAPVHAQLMKFLETVQHNRLVSAEALAEAARDADRAGQEAKRLKQELENLDNELKALKEKYKTAKTASGGASEFSISLEGREVSKSWFAAYFASKTKLRDNAALLLEGAKKNSKQEEEKHAQIFASHSQLEIVEKNIRAEITKYNRERKYEDSKKRMEEVSKKSSEIAATAEEYRKSNNRQKLDDAASALLAQKEVSSKEIAAAEATLDAE